MEEIIEILIQNFDNKEAITHQELNIVKDYLRQNFPLHQLFDYLNAFQTSLTLLAINVSNIQNTDKRLIRVTKKPYELNEFYQNQNNEQYKKMFIKSIIYQTCIIQEIDIKQYYANNWIILGLEYFDFLYEDIRNIKLIELVNNKTKEYYHNLGQQVAKCSNLKKLNVNLKFLFIEKETIESLFQSISKCQNIEYFECNINGLDQNYFTLESAVCISNCLFVNQNTLIKIDLSFDTTSFGDEGITLLSNAIAQCLNLQTINCDICNSQVDLLGLQNLFIDISKCIKLTHLSVSFRENQFKNQNQQFKLGNEMNCLVNLQNFTLIFEQCKLEDNILELLLQYISFNSSLKSLILKLEENFLTGQGIYSSLVHITTLPNLNKLHLDLRQSLIKSEELKQIGNLIGKMKNIQILMIRMQADKICEQSAEQFGNSFKQCQNLTSLTLNLKSIQYTNGKQVIDHIMSGISYCSKLTDLSLNFHEYLNGYGVCQQWDKIINLSNLQILSITYTPPDRLTQKQITSLANAISRCQNITTLIFKFSSQSIGQYFKQIILELKNSKKLHIFQTCVSFFLKDNAKEIQFLKRKVKYLVVLKPNQIEDEDL